MAIGNTNAIGEEKAVYQEIIKSSINVAPGDITHVSITWDKPFKDSNYLLSVCLTGGSPWGTVNIAVPSNSKTNSGCLVELYNQTGSPTASASISVQALGILA